MLVFEVVAAEAKMAGGGGGEYIRPNQEALIYTMFERANPRSLT
jgi:hypothetical protein